MRSSDVPTVPVRPIPVDDTVVMFAAANSDLAWSVAGILALVGLWWLARKIDPHWVAKDGQAFDCGVQLIDTSGGSTGRWRNARARLDGRQLQLLTRGAGGSISPTARFEVIGRSLSPPKGKAVYLIRSADDSAALAIPASSRARATLDAITD
jgi:hypothetical protein